MVCITLDGIFVTRRGFCTPCSIILAIWIWNLQQKVRPSRKRSSTSAEKIDQRETTTKLLLKGGNPVHRVAKRTHFSWRSSWNRLWWDLLSCSEAEITSCSNHTHTLSSVRLEATSSSHYNSIPEWKSRGRSRLNQRVLWNKERSILFANWTRVITAWNNHPDAGIQLWISTHLKNMGFMQSSSDPCMYSSNKSSTLESMWTTLSWPDVLRLHEWKRWRLLLLKNSSSKTWENCAISFECPWCRTKKARPWRTGIYQECYQEIWNAGLYSSQHTSRCWLKAQNNNEQRRTCRSTAVSISHWKLDVSRSQYQALCCCESRQIFI